MHSLTPAAYCKATGIDQHAGRGTEIDRILDKPDIHLTIHSASFTQLRAGDDYRALGWYLGSRII